MSDMNQVIQPKSDQVNADDFIGGPKTFTIEAVAITPGTEQPVQIKLANEPRAFRPCKSMSRVLVAAWGPDAKAYAGRSLTLYRDPKVKWGGMEVGGIRISHLSHIERDMMIQLTATKGKRAPHIVRPLVAEVAQHPAADPARKWADAYINAVNECQDADALNALANSKATKLAELQGKRPELHTECVHALDNRRAALTFEPEGKPDTDMGEGFTDTAEPADWEE
jgi:hypothetical protein